MSSARLFLIRIFLGLCLTGLLGLPNGAQGHSDSTVLRLGVFAYLGVAQTTAEYVPLVQYLNRVQHHRIELRVLPLDDLTRAVELGEVDLLTTNPTHFILVRHQFPLSGVIATRQFRQDDGSLTGQLGGVIVVRSDRTDLQTAHDLVGMRVATPTRENMGGYRAQVYELMQEGVRIETKARAILTTETHQRAIAAILEGEADVAFVRTGVIERMVQQGELDSNDVRVLLPKQFPGFSQRLSTALYPEWPFLALPHVDPHAVHSIASALYGIENLPEAERPFSLRYSFPGDYSKVEELARAMRLPPYDAPLNITLQDVWRAYWGFFLFGIAAFSIILLLLTRVSVARSRVRDALAYKESTMDSLGEGVYESDARGRITYINPAGCRILGYDREEVLGQDAHTLFHYLTFEGKPLPRTECAIHKSVLNHAVDILEEWFVHKQGHMIPVRAVVSPIVYRGVINGHITAFLDLTSQREYEAKMASQTERLNYIIEGTRAGTWEWHIPSGTLILNDIWYELLGHTRDTLGEVTPAIWQTLIHPEDVDRALQGLNDYLEGRSEVYDLSFRMKHAQNDWVWIQAKGKIIQRDLKGEPILMAGTHQDVSTIKHTELHLRDTNQRLREAIEYAHVMAEKAEQASAAKSHFLGRMSHEMRTPMNGVIGMATVLRQTPLESEQKNMVDVILQSGEDMLQLVDKILAYTHIQSGAIVFEPVHFAPIKLVQDVVSRVQAQAQNKGLNLTVESALTPSFECVSDAQRIEQVLSHLLSNAVRFTTQGQIIIRVSVHHGNTAHLRIEVSDTGAGIPEKDLPHLFDQFMQGDESLTRTYGGAGLGLAISREILLALQGDIGVESVPGKGSTFWFTLPIEVSDVISCTPTLQHCRIVLVDPVQTSRDEALHILSREGAQVFAVSAITLGLLKVRAEVSAGHPITAFILRYAAEEQAPEDLLTEMKDLLNAHKIPLIACTPEGHSMPDVSSCIDPTTEDPRLWKMASLISCALSQQPC